MGADGTMRKCISVGKLGGIETRWLLGLSLGLGLFFPAKAEPTNLPPVNIRFKANFPGFRSGIATDVQVVGNLAYVATYGGMVVLDISNPAIPHRVGGYSSVNSAASIAVSGGYAFLGTENGNLEILDIRNPANPVRAGGYATPPGEFKFGGIALASEHAYLAAGDAGLLAIDVRDPGNPRRVRSYSTVTRATDVYLQGNLAYVVSGYGGGLEIIQASAPTNMQRVGFYQTNRNCYGVQVAGDYAYVTGDSDLLVFDISNSASPQIVGSYDSTDIGLGICVAGHYAYLATSYAGLQVIDISNPASPQIVGSYDSTDTGEGIFVAGHYAYLANSYAGLQVIDVSNPANPSRAGGFSTYWAVQEVAVMGNYVYVANSIPGLQVIDVSNPASPALVGSAATGRQALDVQVAGPYAYVAADFDPGLEIFDVSDPSKLQSVGRYDTGAASVQVVGRYAYLTSRGDDIEIVDVSNPANPTHVQMYGYSGVKVAGNLAYVTANDFRGQVRLHVLEVSAPPSLTALGSCETGIPASDALWHLHVAGKWVYLVSPSDEDEGLTIFDVSNPASPHLVRRYTDLRANDLYVSANYAFVTHLAGLQVIDVSIPTNLVVVGSYSAIGFVGLQVVGNFVFAAHNDQGVTILDLGPAFASSPSVPAQPEDHRTLEGSSARFFVGATGTIPLSYQWYFNGTNIPGAIQPLLTLTNVQFSQSGQYSCVVSNSSGIMPSSNATLSVDFPATIVLTNPTDYQVFMAPATILLGAEAFDPDTNGSVAKVEFYEGTNLLATVTNAPFTAPWTNVPMGAYLLTARATDNEGARSASSTSRITVTNVPVFQLSQSHYVVSESNEAVIVTVRRNTDGAAAVSFFTLEGTARAIPEGGIGNYYAVSNLLTFPSNVMTTNISIHLVNDLVYRGNKEFLVNLSNPYPIESTNTWYSAYPSNALVTIIDDDPTWTTNSFTDVVRPTNAPAGGGSLTVTLSPPEGRWRFAWETRWRNSGDTAIGLAEGSYSVEFRPVVGYETPASVSKKISAEASEKLTCIYTPGGGPPQYGALSIALFPPDGQWRLQTDPGTNWHDSRVVLQDLPVGLHVIEFTPPAGYRTPDPQEVLVEANKTNSYLATFETNAPAFGLAPQPLPGFTTDITNSLRIGAPFAFNGQIRANAQYGSGFVVKLRTVLTAAHVVFDDKMLSYATNIWWFFQRDREAYEPLPQTPRGAHLLIGYDAARARDLARTNGMSLVDSQTLDVAALFFFEDAGRGGFGGYLTTGTTNDWLGSASWKMLVGYPVEGVPEEDRGRLHAVGPFPLAFEHVSTNQVLYQTDRITSYGGNSGGPLCVQTRNSRDEDFYIPAGVYLGGSGRAVVRAIDLDVVNLINAAEHSANGGTNSTGGGVITFLPVIPSEGQQQTVVNVRLGPPLAVQLGAKWRVSPTNYGRISYLTNFTNYMGWSDTLVFGSNNFTIEWTDVEGFITPSNRMVELAPGTSVAFDLTYLPLPLTIISNPVSRTVTLGATVTFGVTATGIPPLRYRWQFNGTNLIGATNSTLVLSNLTFARSGDYRVVVTMGYGGTATSSNARLDVVQPLAPLLSVARLGQDFILTITGSTGVSYRIERAAELAPTNWSLFQNLTLSSDFQSLTNSLVTNTNAQFYRAVWSTNQ